mgnify:CR=1 FL=1
MHSAELQMDYRCAEILYKIFKHVTRTAQGYIEVHNKISQHEQKIVRK